MFKPEPRKTNEDAAHVVWSVYGSTADFLDPADDMPVFKEEIVTEDTSWDCRDLTSKHNSEPSALQRVEELCQTYCFAVASNVRAV